MINIEVPPTLRSISARRDSISGLVFIISEKGALSGYLKISLPLTIPFSIGILLALIRINE